MKLETRNGLTLPLWGTFNLETYLDDLKAYHARGLLIADEIAAIENPTFKDIIVPFTLHSKEFGLQNMSLFHLKEVMSDKYPGINEVAEEAAMLSSVYSSRIGFHKGLYNAYVKVRDSKEFGTLTSEENFIVTEAIRDFEIQGINLPEDKQKELTELNERESELTTKFAANSLFATDAWTLHLEDKSRLKGLTEDAILKFQNEAKKRDLPGFLIDLKYESYDTIQSQADERSLREEIWTAYNTRASEIGPNGGEYDNSDIIVELISIRSKQAKILGFNSYSELSISSKMAGGVGVKGVDDFFNTIKARTLPKSKEELDARSKFAKETFSIDKIMPWDLSYVSRHFKIKYYDIDNEKVRDYFPLSRVLNGLFETIERLFDCKIRPSVDTSVWHPDVKFYEVCDKGGNVFAGFYTDLLERKGKASGAWMDNVSDRLNIDNTKEFPTAFLITNFRNIGTGENYVSHSEVTTLFHEAGHVFHDLLGESNYLETSMMNVERDTVELPSQLLEEWAWKKDVLQSMSAHKETGEQLPDELFEKIIATKNFGNGYYYGRQVGLGLFDWELHKRDSVTIEEVLTLCSDVFSQSETSNSSPLIRRPHTFGHIFSGGYSAGYFSYNWANVLVADVDSAFIEAGIENEHDVATRYKNEILAKGHTRPMIDSFRAFRGRDPKPELLIPFLGLE